MVWKEDWPEVSQGGDVEGGPPIEMELDFTKRVGMKSMGSCWMGFLGLLLCRSERVCLVIVQRQMGIGTPRVKIETSPTAANVESHP